MLPWVALGSATLGLVTQLLAVVFQPGMACVECPGAQANGAAHSCYSALVEQVEFPFLTPARHQLRLLQHLIGVRCD